MPMKIFAIATFGFAIYLIAYFYTKIKEILQKRNVIAPNILTTEKPDEKDGPKNTQENVGPTFSALANIRGAQGIILPGAMLSNQFRMNNQSHNPEIINVENSNVIIGSSIAVGTFLTLFFYYRLSITTDFFLFSKTFVIVQYQMIPFALANFIIPLILYCKNENLRKFVKEMYSDFWYDLLP